jgi:hypothetical protein
MIFASNLFPFNAFSAAVALMGVEATEERPILASWQVKFFGSMVRTTATPTRVSPTEEAL